MKEAMFMAKVGDDVFGEDPSIKVLEDKLASMFGQQKGLFCPSGTMTNQIGIKVHTQPGDELICEQSSHIYHYEGGGIAFNSGVQAKLLPGNLGRLKVEQIKEAINPSQDWLTRTSLVCLENTVNRAGGSVYELEDLKNISEYCRSNNLKLHLDGARIFNALVAKNQTALEIGTLFDSISVCLSKGLGCPVGSVLLGSDSLIKQARRIRKVLGGGMRQGGYLAAAGIYAIDNHVNRLVDDHQKAKEIALVLKDLSWIESILPVETNIVIFKLSDTYSSEKIAEKMKAMGIILSPFGGKTMRIVTHLDISKEDIERVKSTLLAFQP
jgi:threonine aldolase